jgi:2-keto-4-pentenoate hydratase/2-oxohepta-3-ene-1,7-dioic acid hydratase in catechol pathway
MGYKLVSYDSGKGVRAGIITGDKLIDAAVATGNAAYATTLGILNDWASANPALAKAAAAGTGAKPYDEQQLRAPVEHPGAIYCAGANYADHVAEMAAGQGRDPEPDPHTLGLKAWHFIKSSHAIVGPNAVVKIPSESHKMDWEVELALVIGKKSKDLTAENALDAVAGYMVSNDVSARDLGWRPPMPQTSPFYSDWLAHKSFDGSCPTGPWIVPAQDIGDVQNLGIKLSVNGKLHQNSNTKNMIFNIVEQLMQISLRITLYPGDIVLTGTPAGVGAGKNEFLNPGDQLELWIENIGTLKHAMS